MPEPAPGFKIQARAQARLRFKSLRPAACPRDVGLLKMNCQQTLVKNNSDLHNIVIFV